MNYINEHVGVSGAHCDWFWFPSWCQSSLEWVSQLIRLLWKTADVDTLWNGDKWVPSSETWKYIAQTTGSENTRFQFAFCSKNLKPEMSRLTFSLMLHFVQREVGIISCFFVPGFLFFFHFLLVKVWATLNVNIFFQRFHSRRAW